MQKIIKRIDRWLKSLKHISFMDCLRVVFADMKANKMRREKQTMKKEFIKNNNLTGMVREHVIEEQRR